MILLVAKADEYMIKKEQNVTRKNYIAINPVYILLVCVMNMQLVKATLPENSEMEKAKNAVHSRSKNRIESVSVSSSEQKGRNSPVKKLDDILSSTPHKSSKCYLESLSKRLGVQENLKKLER